jgi:hypothetical protein
MVTHKLVSSVNPRKAAVLIWVSEFWENTAEFAFLFVIPGTTVS